MKTRVISALVGLVLLAAVLVLSETVVLDIAVAFLSAVAIFEMASVAGLLKKKALTATCILFGVFFASTYYQSLASLAGFAEFIFAVVVLLFVLKDHKEIKITDAAYMFLFTVMLPRAFSTILLFRNYGEPISNLLIILSLAVAWLNDTCAYFSGFFFGKHKLCPEISPKKTVEGAIGGVIGDVLLCCVIGLIFEFITDYSINWLNFLIFLPIGAVLAILGDLSASVIKRQFGVKDYGKIMPGHGGVMDRFDSWIFVAPVLYLWNIYLPIV